MFILIYGADGTGKSVQCKSILESAEFSEHWSFATKNRRLYADSSIVSHELLRFNPDSTINPYQTIDAFTDKIKECTKSFEQKLIVIDEITYLRSWAVPVVIESINRDYRAKGKSFHLTKLTGKNKSAWEQVNKIVNGNMELLSNWAVLSDSTIIAITALKDEYRDSVGEDGETESVSTGRMLPAAHRDILKMADIRIKLEKDGHKGRGYYSFWEKVQNWMIERDDVAKIGKDGILTELMSRGVIT